MKQLPKGFSLIALIIVLGLLALGGAFVYSQVKTKDLTMPSGMSADAPTKTTNKAKVADKAVCTNPSLGIQVVPRGEGHKAWGCSTKDGGIEASYLKYFSNFFEITIGDLPRGPYCGDGIVEEQIDRCVIEKYPLDESVARLEIFKVDGETGEVFGKLNSVDVAWLSIKWWHMEDTELTKAQKAELIEALKHIENVN